MLKQFQQTSLEGLYKGLLKNPLNLTLSERCQNIKCIHLKSTITMLYYPPNHFTWEVR